MTTLHEESVLDTEGVIRQRMRETKVSGGEHPGTLNATPMFTFISVITHIAANAM